MKRCIFLLLCCIGLGISHAQTQTDAEILEKIKQASLQVRSLVCDFTQEKHISILDDALVATGTMHYQASDKLRWEYAKPSAFVFILNGNQVLLKSSAQTQLVDGQKDRRFKQMAKMMAGNLIGNSLDDTKSFKSQVQQVDNLWQVTLIPLRNDLKQMWQKVVLYVSKDEQMVSKVEIYELSGDYTRISFTNIQVNQPIDTTVFDMTQASLR